MSLGGGVALGRPLRSVLWFGDMERQLTSFQMECEKRLADALAQVGRRVADRRLDGISET